MFVHHVILSVQDITVFHFVLFVMGNGAAQGVLMKNSVRDLHVQANISVMIQLYVYPSMTFVMVLQTLIALMEMMNTSVNIGFQIVQMAVTVISSLFPVEI